MEKRNVRRNKNKGKTKIVNVFIIWKIARLPAFFKEKSGSQVSNVDQVIKSECQVVVCK